MNASDERVLARLARLIMRHRRTVAGVWIAQLTQAKSEARRSR